MHEKSYICIKIIEYGVNDKEEKKERKVAHLQISEQHEYFGSIKQLFNKYDKNTLGFSIYQVRNNLKNIGEMKSEFCAIRVGVLQSKNKDI